MHSLAQHGLRKPSEERTVGFERVDVCLWTVMPRECAEHAHVMVRSDGQAAFIGRFNEDRCKLLG